MSTKYLLHFIALAYQIDRRSQCWKFECKAKIIIIVHYPQMLEKICSQKHILYSTVEQIFKGNNRSACAGKRVHFNPFLRSFTNFDKLGLSDSHHDRIDRI